MSDMTALALSVTEASTRPMQAKTLNEFKATHHYSTSAKDLNGTKPTTTADSSSIIQGNIGRVNTANPDVKLVEQGIFYELTNVKTGQVLMGIPSAMVDKEALMGDANYDGIPDGFMTNPATGQLEAVVLKDHNGNNIASFVDTDHNGTVDLAQAITYLDGHTVTQTQVTLDGTNPPKVEISSPNSAQIAKSHQGKYTMPNHLMF